MLSSIVVVSLIIIRIQQLLSCNNLKVESGIFDHIVDYPIDPSESGDRKIRVKMGQQFTFVLRLDQERYLDNFDYFISNCEVNGVQFMDKYGCSISNAIMAMPRKMLILSKDDPQLQIDRFRNDKFGFIYLMSKTSGNLEIVCPLILIDCSKSECSRQPGCTNYMSSEKLDGILGRKIIRKRVIVWKTIISRIGAETVNFPWGIVLIGIGILLILGVLVGVFLGLYCPRNGRSKTRTKTRRIVEQTSAELYDRAEESSYHTVSETSTATNQGVCIPSNASRSRMAHNVQNTRIRSI